VNLQFQHHVELPGKPTLNPNSLATEAALAGYHLPRHDAKRSADVL